MNKMSKVCLDCMEFLKIPDNSTNIEIKYELYGTGRPYFKCIDCVFTKFITN